MQIRSLLGAVLLVTVPSVGLAQVPEGRLRLRLPALMDSAGIAGVSIALLDSGAVAWVGAFGRTGTPSAPTVDTLTVFEAASLTKPVVAVGVLRMAARGQLDLDRPLHDILPHPDLGADPRARRITTRMVLSHTSGLPNWRRNDPLTIGFEPGTQYRYSGEGFVWLQRVIERVTATSLAEWAASEVLEPAGMHRSSLIWEERFGDNMALPHNGLGTAMRKAQPDSANAAASLHTTAADYARFLAALWNGRLLDPMSRDALMAGQVPVTDVIAWGLGVGLQNGGDGPALWHWGDNPGYKNFALLFSRTGDGIVYFSNSDAGMSIVHALLVEVFGRDQPAERYIDYERHDSPRRFVRLALDSAMIRGGPRSGIARYHALKSEYPANVFDLRLLDQVGRRVLGAGFADDAIMVLELNAREYPDSSRTHASLGEAYARAGRQPEAVASLERALSLNPQDTAVRQRLAELRRR